MKAIIWTVLAIILLAAFGLLGSQEKNTQMRNECMNNHPVSEWAICKE